MKRFLRKEIEETPPRSIVLIWLIVAAEMGFDLATTIIAFRSFLEDDTCCGKPITLGKLPLGSTIPFFLLVVAELAFLIRAIMLTLWPSMLTGDDDTENTDDLEDPQNRRPKRGCFARYFCCVMRLNARIVFQVISLLVLLNPFFGCVIAWILMYQSDKTEAFVVLGLEGASLILHFISVWLEGTFKTWSQIFYNLIPVIPFSVSIGLVLFYLKQGGVCYLVEDHVFKFTGCEICNITGVPEPCPNSTNLFSGFDSLVSSDTTFDDVKGKLLERTWQGTYCSAERSFCFYDYDDGKQPRINADNSTAVPTTFLDDVTSAPDTSPSDGDDEDGDDTSSPTPAPQLPIESPTERPVSPTEPPRTPEPTEVPMPETDPPTIKPTLRSTPNPTPSPTSEPNDTDTGNDGGGEGSDGFNMDEIGSDGFNPNDLFNRQLDLN
jgi:hypothetical protein